MISQGARRLTHIAEYCTRWAGNRTNSATHYVGVCGIVYKVNCCLFHRIRRGFELKILWEVISSIWWRDYVSIGKPILQNMIRTIPWACGTVEVVWSYGVIYLLTSWSMNHII